MRRDGAGRGTTRAVEGAAHRGASLPLPWRRPASVRLGGAAIALLAVAACGGGSKPDQLLDKVASWTSSARLAAENRAGGATSARYTRDVLHATHGELQQNVQALRTALYSSKDSSQLAPLLRAQAVTAASKAEQTVGDMARLADEEPNAVAALLDVGVRADAAGSEAKSLADSARKR